MRSYSHGRSSRGGSTRYKKILLLLAIVAGVVLIYSMFWEWDFLQLSGWKKINSISNNVNLKRQNTNEPDERKEKQNEDDTMDDLNEENDKPQLVKVDADVSFLEKGKKKLVQENTDSPEKRNPPKSAQSEQDSKAKSPKLARDDQDSKSKLTQGDRDSKEKTRVNMDRGSVEKRRPNLDRSGPNSAEKEERGLAKKDRVDSVEKRNRNLDSVDEKGAMEKDSSERGPPERGPNGAPGLSKSKSNRIKNLPEGSQENPNDDKTGQNVKQDEAAMGIKEKVKEFKEEKDTAVQSARMKAAENEDLPEMEEKRVEAGKKDIKPVPLPPVEGEGETVPPADIKNVQSAKVEEAEKIGKVAPALENTNQVKAQPQEMKEMEKNGTGGTDTPFAIAIPVPIQKPQEPEFPTAADPASAPASAPGSVPASAPASAPGSAPASVPASAPASAPGSVPASAPASAPGSVPASAPASAPGSAPASVPASAPASAPGSVPASAPASAPGSAPASVPASALASVPASAPGSVPASAPASAPGSAPASASPSALASAPASAPGSVRASAPASAPGSAPASVPASAPAAVPASASPSALASAPGSALPASVPPAPVPLVPLASAPAGQMAHEMQANATAPPSVNPRPSQVQLEQGQVQLAGTEGNKPTSFPESPKLKPVQNDSFPVLVETMPEEKSEQKPPTAQPEVQGSGQFSKGTGMDLAPSEKDKPQQIQVGEGGNESGAGLANPTGSDQKNQPAPASIVGNAPGLVQNEMGSERNVGGKNQARLPTGNADSAVGLGQQMAPQRKMQSAKDYSPEIRGREMANVIISGNKKNDDTKEGGEENRQVKKPVITLDTAIDIQPGGSEVEPGDHLRGGKSGEGLTAPAVAMQADHEMSQADSGTAYPLPKRYEPPAEAAAQWEHQNQSKSNSQKYACTVPKLDPWDKSIVGLLDHYPPRICRKVQPNLMYIDNDNYLRINETELASVNLTENQIECVYMTIERANQEEDFQADLGATMSYVKPVQVDKDIIQVNCVTRPDRTLLYGEVLAYPVLDTEKKFTNNSEHVLNVVMIFVDSLSLSAVIRHMPKTYEILKKMGFIAMQAYNKVGDNSFPNVIPILTGKRAHTQQPDMKDEFGEDIRGINFDHWPLIWKNFSSKGYITTFSEEWPDMGLFHLKGYGFRQKPVDHFYINYWKALEWMTYPNNPTTGCYGNKTPARILLDTVSNHLTKFKNIAQWIYAYLTFPAHSDSAQMEMIDHIYSEFFQDMYERQMFNKSVVLFLSDHGHRDSPIRSTTVGLLEERLPMLFLYFPSWFYQKYPHIKENILINTDRLSSNFDIYETMVDILQENYNPNTKQRSISNRGLSLLYPIPINRTCKSAGIPVYFCTCQQLKWTPITVQSALAKYAAVDFVYALNEIVNKNEKCSRWTLKRLLMAEIMDISAEDAGVTQTPIAVIQSDTYDTNWRMIRVTVETEVAFVNGTFQALMLYNKKEKQLRLHSDIGRLDKFGKQSACVLRDGNSQLKKTCVCRNFIENTTMTQ